MNSSFPMPFFKETLLVLSSSSSPRPTAYCAWEHFVSVKEMYFNCKSLISSIENLVIECKI